MRNALPALLALVWVGACGDPPEYDAVTERTRRADSVAIAMETFSAAAFDTITWESRTAVIDRGGLVFSISCAKCHGVTGRGNGDFVLNGDTLRPPTFLGPEWPYAHDPVGLRKRIFSGNVVGMPYWGLVGLKYRDIDAVATYITDYLRPS